MIDVICTYCGESDSERLGPGRLLREDAPRVNQMEIGDVDILYRCRRCNGVFGVTPIRSYPVQEGKIGIGKGIIV
jgi:hypothetical protein